MVAVISLAGQMGICFAAVSGFFPNMNSFTMTLPGIAGLILIRRVANTPIMKLAIMPTSRVKPKEKMEPVVDWPWAWTAQCPSIRTSPPARTASQSPLPGTRA